MNNDTIRDVFRQSTAHHGGARNIVHQRVRNSWWGAMRLSEYCIVERTILQTARRSSKPGLALHNQAQETLKKKIGPYEGRTRDLGVCKA